MTLLFGKDASEQNTVTSLQNSIKSTTSQDFTSSNVVSSTTLLPPSYKILADIIESESAINQSEQSQEDDNIGQYEQSLKPFPCIC